MAITFLKQPLKFFNVNEPAIFEFSSDADLGVNVNDLVADLEIRSLYTTRRYTVTNILPNYNTGVFRLNVSGYLKSLMLDNFTFEYDNPNKQFTIERFSIGVSVRAENGADIFADEYIFDSGYIFDTTFIFAEQTPSDSETDDSFYPMIGISQLYEALKPQKDLTKFNILAPKYVEFCEGFTNTLSIFTGELGAGQTFVGGIAGTVTATTGVATAVISDAQIAKMYLPTLITTTLNNPAIPCYGLSYKTIDCEDTFQIRFFTSYGGWCYFYTPKETFTASRGKTEYVNNNFYNVQDGKSAQIQRASTGNKRLTLSGIKPLELQEAFNELLESPKVEILLPRGFIECEVSGSFNLKKFDFDYNLNVEVANINGMTL
jgi:hypothetical protein